MKKPRLVSIGDLMLDVMVRADEPLEAASDVPGTVRFRSGGSAANTTRAFAGLGGTAVMIGALGSDRIGRSVVGSLRSSGVVVHAVMRAGPTPRLAALIEPSGERTFITQRGVADQISASDLKSAWLARVDVLHLPAYSLLRPPLSEAALHAAQVIRSASGLVSVDLASRAPLLAAGSDHGLRAVRAAAPDILFANADEVAALVGRRGARRLLDVAPIVVVKQGSAGCHVVWRGLKSPSEVLEIAVATRPLVVHDTTGAGDAFDAGFLYVLVSGGHSAGSRPSAALLRRAALAGHRAATRLLSSRRPELAL